MTEQEKPVASVAERLAVCAAASLVRGEGAELPADGSLPAEAILALVDALSEYAQKYLGCVGLAWHYDGRRLLGKALQRR